MYVIPCAFQVEWQWDVDYFEIVFCRPKTIQKIGRSQLRIVEFKNRKMVAPSKPEKEWVIVQVKTFTKWYVTTYYSSNRLIVLTQGSSRRLNSKLQYRKIVVTNLLQDLSDGVRDIHLSTPPLASKSILHIARKERITVYKNISTFITRVAFHLIARKEPCH